MTAIEYFNSVRGERAAWKSAFSRCMWCGGSDILDVHEIERRSAAPRSWGTTCNYVVACGSLSSNNCHEKVFGTLSHAVQLAVKLLRNPTAYDLQSWLKISDPDLRAPLRVTQKEVDKEAKKLQIFFEQQSGMRF